MVHEYKGFKIVKFKGFYSVSFGNKEWEFEKLSIARNFIDTVSLA